MHQRIFLSYLHELASQLLDGRNVTVESHIDRYHPKRY